MERSFLGVCMTVVRRLLKKPASKDSTTTSYTYSPYIKDTSLPYEPAQIVEISKIALSNTPLKINEISKTRKAKI